MDKKIAVIVAVAVACLATGTWADYIDDDFPGTSLGSDWRWNHMGSCTGSVNNGLILNPRDGSSGWRQSAIASDEPSYSWVTMGGAVTYAFTVGSWDLTSNNNVAARMYLSTADGKASPEAWDDYNNSNGVMAELSLNGGHFWFNLFEKNGQASTSYNNDTYKLSYLDVGTAVDGYTFAMELSGTVARIWFHDGVSLHAGANVVLSTAGFNQDTRTYVGLINGTGANLGAGETVTFSNVTVIPEPTAIALLLGGLYLVRRRIVSRKR